MQNNHIPNASALAMDTFRRNFNMPMVRMIAYDGEMAMPFKHYKAGPEYLSKAKQVIAEMGLPLDAKLTVSQRANVIFMSNILISHKG